MEEVFDAWQDARARPQFKCEYLVTWNIADQLEEAARYTAARIGLDKDETASLVERYTGYAYELRGPDVKPVPNVLFGISSNSRDHTPKVYEEAF